MGKIKNKFELGDRCRMRQTENLGIVIDLDFITNEGGKEPRAKVHWTKKDPEWHLDLVDGWICEGNLINRRTRVFTETISPLGLDILSGKLKC